MEIQIIQSKIYEIRGRRVMWDFDLAQLYQVETKRLKEAVRRNLARFEGDDFMFELTEDEYNFLTIRLRSQIASSNPEFSNWQSKERGGRRYMPFAFTETGVAMLSSVLRNETAILINRSIMRAFVEMRNYIITTSTITAELAEIRATIELLRREGEETLEAVNDLSEDTRKHIENIYNAIGELSVKTPRLEKPRRPIGFNQGNE
jgi:hypothetical protein